MPVGEYLCAHLVEAALIGLPLWLGTGLAYTCLRWRLEYTAAHQRVLACWADYCRCRDHPLPVDSAPTPEHQRYFEDYLYVRRVKARLLFHDYLEHAVAWTLLWPWAAVKTLAVDLVSRVVRNALHAMSGRLQRWADRHHDKHLATYLPVPPQPKESP